MMVDLIVMPGRTPPAGGGDDSIAGSWGTKFLNLAAASTQETPGAAPHSLCVANPRHRHPNLS